MIASVLMCMCLFVLVCATHHQIMTGKDKGKQGEVIRVVRDQRFPRVFVSGINMVRGTSRRDS